MTHDSEGIRHVYRPTTAREDARASVIDHLVRTFFNGSKAQAMAALLDDESTDLSDADLERLSAMIAAARRRKP